MPRCHAAHSTSSPGKIDSEAFILGRLNPENNPRPGYILGPVGCVDRAAAHVLFWQAQGHAPPQQIMIDCNHDTYSNLVSWAAATGYQGRVIYGRMEEVIPKLFAAGIRITSLDADVNTHYGQLQDDLATLILRHNIERAAFTFTTRGRDDFYDRLCFRHDIQPKRAQQANGRLLTDIYEYKGRVRVRAPRCHTHELVPAHLGYRFRGSLYGISEYMPYRGVTCAADRGGTGMGTICIKLKGEI